ncbi:MAG: peptidoglycan DD-metalloendopeptidase family protein [Clostridia bacterium]|nr:peptidoglycan DD-metalloendopeptidase family protein [Clostridia bacterium]
MTKFSTKKKILSLVLTLVLLFTAIFSYQMSASAENSKIDEYKDKIEQYEEKIDAAQEKIDALKGDINEVKAYIQELDSQVAMYQEQIDAYQAQIDEYQAKIDEYTAQNEELTKQIEELNVKIDDYNAQIAEKEAQIEEKYDELKEVIRANFINGETSALEVLLCSEDFSDYLTRTQFLSSMTDFEQGLIDGINADIAAIDEVLKQVNIEKENIVKIQSEIDAKILEIETLQTAVEDNQAKVEANQAIILEKVNENSNYLESLNNESAEYKAMISEYKNAIEQFDREIEKLIQQNASSGSGTLANSSGLICPLQYGGTYISSPFYRNSDGSYHGALDLCVSGGSYGKAISAAESGRVVTAAYHWSYGNYVVIDHGNGLSTLYAHCSSLSVGSGQSVSKGQTIGYVGSTGNSTGPHLHFEVRVNGSRVNPSAYISV